jgi:outer membrane protein assembly factor BamA
MLGVGTSSTDKLILSGSISQNNFLGSGNNVSIQVNSANPIAPTRFRTPIRTSRLMA